MAEGLERRACNLEAPSSSPTLTASWIRSRSSRVQILGLLLVGLWKTQWHPKEMLTGEF